MKAAPGFLLAVFCALGACSVAHAQNYPAKPIRLVVPLAPGGGNDTLARYVGKYMTESLGQSVVVENRAGGGGLAGGEYVARSAPDGYTLVVAGSGLIVVTLTHKQFNFQRDLTPIAMIGEYATLLVCHASLPVTNVREVIKLAQARPGRLNFASAANGGDAITVSYNSGVNFSSEPRKDGPNRTDTEQNNGGAGIKCSVGGYVDGPAGTLAGTRGAKEFDNSCVDRTTNP